MGTVAVKYVKPSKGSGSLQRYAVAFKGSASYATYGDTMHAHQIGAPSILPGATAAGYNSSGQGQYLATLYCPDLGANGGEGAKTGKWIITQNSDGAEVANTTDLSAITFQTVVHGA